MIAFGIKDFRRVFPLPPLSHCLNERIQLLFCQKRHHRRARHAFPWIRRGDVPNHSQLIGKLEESIEELLGRGLVLSQGKNNRRFVFPGIFEQLSQDFFGWFPCLEEIRLKPGLELDDSQKMPDESPQGSGVLRQNEGFERSIEMLRPK